MSRRVSAVSLLIEGHFFANAFMVAKLHSPFRSTIDELPIRVREAADFSWREPTNGVSLG